MQGCKRSWVNRPSIWDSVGGGYSVTPTLYILMMALGTVLSAAMLCATVVLAGLMVYQSTRLRNYEQFEARISEISHAVERLDSIFTSKIKREAVAKNRKNKRAQDEALDESAEAAAAPLPAQETREALVARFERANPSAS